jgi:phenylpropionate dioxygenase-like ring-hydroxylating dioxygenase large terminal subunit
MDVEMDVHDSRAAAVYAGVERELGRKGYPENFPILPEVPVSRYTDPRFYDLEMRHFWPSTWLHAGHISEIPEPGSYKLFEQLGQSIIISRGADGAVQAFHNVCRHRASAILTEPQGKVRRFVCPYHSWSYALDGSLLAVPEERDFACLDKSKRGLVPVRSGTMRGMIFINLDGKAPPIEEYFAATDRELGDFPIEDMVVRRVIAVEMDCNWKAALDNFLEMYHVNTVHAKSIAPYLNTASFLVSLYTHGHARFATRKRGANTIFEVDRAAHDGPSALFKEHTIALPMFPNSFMAIDPVGFGWQTWWPLGQRKSVMIFSLMGWKGEEDPAFLETMVSQVNTIANEDVRLFGDLQRSLDSGVMSSILMGYQERALYWYQEEIDRAIGAGNIPEDLRIAQVLEPFAEQ